MSAKIKSGDDVIVLTGKDRHVVGKVIKVIVSNNRKKVVVTGVHVCRKHTKYKADNSGGILSKELAIDISNVAILDPKYHTPTRIGFKLIDGKKVRFAKASGTVID